MGCFGRRPKERKDEHVDAVDGLPVLSDGNSLDVESSKRVPERVAEQEMSGARTLVSGEKGWGWTDLWLYQGRFPALR